MTRNNFPPHYAENISETNLPAELMPDYTTIEYEFPNKQAGPPMFLFVVDTAISEEELDGLKDSLQEALTILPENALVGLITFGTMVQVHELGFGECPRAYVFRGNKDVPADKITTLLGLRKPAQPGQPGRHPGSNPGQQQAQQTSRFMLPVSECNLVLDSILEDLAKDPWPVFSRAASATVYRRGVEYCCRYAGEDRFSQRRADNDVCWRPTHRRSWSDLRP